jgi:ATP-dependent Clp protease protease subunit
MPNVEPAPGTITEPAPTPSRFTTDVYGVFVDGINQENAKRLISKVAPAQNAGFKNFHVMFQSFGGTVGDGVMLYNFLRALPVETYFYNVGQISSAGVLVYLGAKHRIASPRALFMLHKTTWGGSNSLDAGALGAVVNSLALDDERTAEIWDENLKLTSEMKAALKRGDLWLTAQQALECGLATELGDFACPPGFMFNYI